MYKLAACAAALLAAIVIDTAPLSAQALKKANAKDGEDVFRKCRACHQVGKDAKNMTGPKLTNIIGRKVGSVEGFNYSPANKAFGESGKKWTKDELIKYLANPRAYMPGNRMAFVGLKDAQDIADVIAYLEEASK